MAIPLSGPISFGDLNDELDKNTNDTLDLIQAGLDFGFSPGAPSLGGNWTDGVAGLSMSEFYGGVGGGKAENAIYYTADSPYKLLNAGQPGPATVLVSPQSPFAYGIPAGGHTIDVNVLADGTYYALGQTLLSSLIPTAPISPNQGVSGSVSQLNPHTISVSSLPATTEEFSDVGYPPNTPQNPQNTNSILRGAYNLQDENSLSATVLDVLQVYQLYNNQTLTGYNASGVQNPSGYPTNVIPYQAGLVKVWTFKWKFNTSFGISTSAPGNNLPNTDTTFVVGPTPIQTNLQNLEDNYVLSDVYANVSQNPSPTSQRETWIYAYAPSAGTGTWSDEMNKGGDTPLASPSNPTNFYYAIPIKQEAAPAAANTLIINPSTADFNYIGGPQSFSLNITPNSNPWSYTKTGPDAPLFTVSGLNPSGVGDDGNFTITTGPYTGVEPNTAQLNFTHPGGPVILPITQTGLSLRAFGAFAPGAVGTPVPFNGVTRNESINTDAPPNTPWTFTSNQPYVTIPAPNQSGTGPSPISYTVSPNPLFTPRPAVVTVDFNVGGTPYTIVNEITQTGQPAVPEISVVPNGGTLTYSGTAPQTKNVTVNTNEPFSVNLGGSDVSYWGRTATPSAPASQTNFTVPPGSPSIYVFGITTDGANDDYDFRNASFTVTSPVSPGTYITNLVQNRNPAFAYLNFNTPTATGNWTYTTQPSPQGGRLLTPGNPGPASIGITAHPNLPWSITLTQPHPAIPTGVFNTNPISTTSGTGPGTWSTNLPIGNPADNYTYRVNLFDNASDAVASDEVGLVFGKYVSVPDVFTLSNAQATIPSAGGSSSTRTLTSNVPWETSVSGPLAPALTINPSPSGTGPATISFSAPAVGPTPRTASVTFNNSVGAVTIPVIQKIPDFINISPTDLSRSTPYAISLVFPISVDGNAVFNKTETAPWFFISPSGPQLASPTAQFDIIQTADNPGPGSRTAIIDINSPTAPQVYTISVTQAAPPAPEPPPPDPEPEPILESISVPAPTTAIPSSGGTTPTRLVSTSPTSLFWVATKSGPGAPAFSVNPSSNGNGPRNVSVTGGSNTTGSPRYVDITFTSLTSPASDSFRVTQLAAPIPEPIPDEFNIPSTSTSIPSSGGRTPDRSLTTTPNSLAWNGSSSNPVFSINPSTSGNGPATIWVSVPANTGTSQRTSTISFTSNGGNGSFSISQPAPPIPNTFAISPTTPIIAPYVGPRTYPFTTSGNVSYAKTIPTSASPWLSISPTTSPSLAGTSFSIRMTNNSSQFSRFGSVTLSSPAGNYIVQVEQDGAPSPTPSPGGGLNPRPKPGEIQ